MEALSIQDVAVHRALSDAIQKLYSNVTVSPGECINATQLQSICDYLGTDIRKSIASQHDPLAESRELGLRKTLLRIIEEHGDKSCIVAVRRVAKLVSRTKGEAELQEIALRLFPILAVVSMVDSVRASNALEFANHPSPSNTEETVPSIPEDEVQEVKDLLMSDMERMD